MTKYETKLEQEKRDFGNSEFSKTCDKNQAIDAGISEKSTIKMEENLAPRNSVFKLENQKKVS